MCKGSSRKKLGRGLGSHTLSCKNLIAQSESRWGIFTFFSFCLEKKEVKKLDSFHNFNSMPRIIFYVNLILKKIFALISLQVLHICIIILWTFFSKFLRVIYHELLILWAFSHGTDISCNLHALPDYYFVTCVPSAAGKTAILLAKTIMHAKTFAILQKKKNDWYFVAKIVLTYSETKMF